MVTRFLGMEGTAYTAVARENELVNVSIMEYLTFLWGEKFYKGIPAAQRRKVETDVIGITIKVDRIDAEGEDLPTLTASDINDENENIVLSKLTEGSKPRTTDTVAKTLTTFLLGAAVMYFAIHQGWLA